MKAQELLNEYSEKGFLKKLGGKDVTVSYWTFVHMMEHYNAICEHEKQ